MGQGLGPLCARPSAYDIRRNPKNATGTIIGVPPVSDITGIKDYYSDHPDLLWSNTGNGNTAIWLMEGTSRSATAVFGAIRLVCDIAGTGDFNCKSDIVWRNTSTGNTLVWQMDGFAREAVVGIIAPTTFTNAELFAYEAWVNGGGNMVVTCDSASYDAVCEHFGHPVTNSAVNPHTPTAEVAVHPLFEGPFESAPSINMAGSQGFFAVIAGATMLAEDAAGNPTVLERKLGRGRVVLMADVDPRDWTRNAQLITAFVSAAANVSRSV